MQVRNKNLVTIVFYYFILFCSSRSPVFLTYKELYCKYRYTGLYFNIVATFQSLQGSSAHIQMQQTTRNADGK